MPPSEGIQSTSDGGMAGPNNDSIYAAVQGTSFSARVVSGVMALALALNSSLTPDQLKLLLTNTARSFPTGTTDDCTTARCGTGLVDAHAVVSAVVSGNVPGLFADGTKIELLGGSPGRSGGLAAGALALGLLIAGALRYRARRRR